ncbi:MAG: hypothetical protein ABSB79_07935, partial [Syntrophales bacterium]
ISSSGSPVATLSVSLATSQVTILNRTDYVLQTRTVYVLLTNHDFLVVKYLCVQYIIQYPSGDGSFPPWLRQSSGMLVRRTNQYAYAQSL